MRPVPSPQRIVPCLLALCLLALCPFGYPAAAGHAATAAPTDPLEPPGTGGVAAVERALATLSTHRRLLVVAAHPDDEDTTLLSLVSRGMGGEAAYLSLTRGEGGQNLIGPELGVGLGLLRSRELLAAREIDGARQFFSRAYDFGYTRSLDETLERWPREELARDVARVIRRFRPQVVMSVFPGTPFPTHGQHQAAGVVTHEVFPVVGEPGSFPELTAQGLPPYQPQALYRATWFDPGSTTLTLDAGRVDPVTGRSIFQLAMASRSQHRSQDMGVLQPLGSVEARLGWVEGGGGAEAADLFAGIDTRLPALAATLPAGDLRERVAGLLAEVETEAQRSRRELSPEDLGATVPAFAAMLADLEAAHRALSEAGGGEAAAVARLVGEKLDAARQGLLAAAGLAVDAFTEDPELVPGESFQVTTHLWNSGGLPVTLDSVTLSVPTGWTAAPAPAAEEDDGMRRRFGPVASAGTSGPLPPGVLSEGSFEVAVPPSAPASRPYFLERPPAAGTDLYDWTGVDPEIQALPFEPPPVTARFIIDLDGLRIPIEREVVARRRDQIRGEVRQPLAVVPALELSVEPDLLVWSTDAGARSRPQEVSAALPHVTVTLTRNATAAIAGQLEVTAPPGWPPVPLVPFHLGETTPSLTLTVPLHPPAGLSPGYHHLTVEAVTEDGRRFDLAVPQVAYEHVRPTPWPQRAEVTVSATDLALPPLTRVGYVRGASDRVPEMLAQVGVPIELLTPHELLQGDLGAYDAIVVGSRAYETDPALVQANPKLLAYVEAGGLLIVQYQQYQFAQGGYAPLPLDISRPHDRVTDETAPVTLLAPGHPLFHAPNRIGAADWQGWVQERGLYFAGTWDPGYTAPLEMADPDDEAGKRGALLVAPVGDGVYVYTGLAFFRQLPAGVPGAYRLFANLLGLRSTR